MKTTKQNAAAVQNGEAKAQDTQVNNLTAVEPGETKAAEDAPAAGEKPSEEPASPEPAANNVVAFRRPTLGLDATLKVLDSLYRESIKRENLLTRIKQLEDFEIMLMEESDEMEPNHFQGCKLAIFDSKGRQFVTNTSGLVKLVAEFVKKSCYEKLAEIEAQIVFPNAA